MYAALRPLLFTLPPAQAHRVAMLALAPVERSALLARTVRALLGAPSDRLAVDAMGLRFPSPVGIAGGFDKNGDRPRALAALGFGFVEVGTVTAEAQGPNPSPNLFRLPDDRALVNRLGFPNEGAERVAARLRAMGGSRGIGVPLAVSIGKSRSVPLAPIDAVIADYIQSFDAVRSVADFVIVNVSSPNTKGLRALQDPAAARELLGELARRAKDAHLPLLLKIAPDLDEPDVDAILGVVREVRLQGVVCANTSIRREGLRTSSAEVERIGAGGLSGPPLYPRALDLVRRARAALGPRATVIGVGGIERTAQVREMLEAGADLVQIYTGFIYEGPLLPTRIARELGGALEREGIHRVTSLGAAGETALGAPGLSH